LSGILENILQVLQSIDGRLAAQAGAPQQYTQPPQQYAQAIPQQAPPQQYVAPPQQAPVQQAPPQNITADTILALIQPHIGNPVTKEALGGAMRAMGINALPDTQPHQFAELYARFQAVLSQPVQQAPAVQPTSII
jgi:hypothetical protein